MTKRLEITPENPEGILVDLTAEEIAQKETDRADWETEKAQADTEAQAKADLKASAKAKLISGEALTEEEANTIVL
tara:strand:+ start:794 stop:1021 length:228 start_codon:yes stop_codon:yes gene_type:complete